jgi:hypothetical protein
LVEVVAIDDREASSYVNDWVRDHSSACWP